MIDENVAQERLNLVQSKLFNNQKEMNKSMENFDINVLVENKLENQNKFFGRNNYISPVIFDGNEKDIGKIVKVKIQTSNQSTLFGFKNQNMRAA
jgi:2-methylthioadenine synthetase